MCDDLTPEERLRRVARLPVKAMYLYVAEEDKISEGNEHPNTRTMTARARGDT